MKTQISQKYLGDFREIGPTIATLEAGKTLMQVVTPRKSEIWLVLPATGADDHRCILVDRRGTTKLYRNQIAKRQREELLKTYQERITK